MGWDVWCQCGLCGQKPLLSLCYTAQPRKGLENTLRAYVWYLFNQFGLTGMLVLRKLWRSLSSFLSSAESREPSKLQRSERPRKLFVANSKLRSRSAVELLPRCDWLSKCYGNGFLCCYYWNYDMLMGILNVHFSLIVLLEVSKTQCYVIYCPCIIKFVKQFFAKITAK